MSRTVANTSPGEGLVIDGRIVLTLEAADEGRARLAISTRRGRRELACGENEPVALDEHVSVEPLDVSAGTAKLAVSAPPFVSIWRRDEYPDPVELPA